ncbi:hypothetical protein GCM10010174_39850 [Kutzneria viridogrisea]
MRLPHHTHRPTADPSAQAVTPSDYPAIDGHAISSFLVACSPKGHRGKRLRRREAGKGQPP